MKLFISWSGERSQALAQALHEWAPLVLHYVEPWVSKSDIEAGERWAIEVAKELEASNFGLICVTRENITSPWLLFESGALAKSMQEGRVIPLLLDIEFKDVSGPLAQFQAQKVDREGLRKTIDSMNRFSPQKVLEARLSQLFDMAWSSLEEKISEIPEHATVKHNRPQSEILEELVSTIRGLDARVHDAFDDEPRFRRRRMRFHPMMFEDISHHLKLGRDDPLRLLIMASFVRDDLPWVYELAVDAYRAGPSKSERSRAAMNRLSTAFRAVARGPFLEFARDKETHMMMMELDHLLREEFRAVEDASEEAGSEAETGDKSET